MERRQLDVVTGAFGYTGRYIARRLLALGRRVRTLTGHPTRPDPFGGRVEVAPLAFDDPTGLVRSLRGSGTLYNTYWIRFPYGRMTFARAVENTKCLVRAAEEAGVRRVVHVSIANASEASPLPYFRGKGEVERVILESRLSYAILRPSVLFGGEDVLLNNVAWCLRRFPLFAVPGAGDYRLQPIFVEDLAEIAVSAGERQGRAVLDAVGPQTYTFEELVRRVGGAVRSRARVVHLSPRFTLMLSRVVGWTLRDVMLTRDEIAGLMANLLVSGKAPAGKTKFSEWLAGHASRLGIRYASELGRHFR